MNLPLLMPKTRDARAAPRKVLRCGAKVLFTNTSPLKVRMVDISTSGMCLMAPENIAADQICNIVFETTVHEKIYRLSVIAKSVYSICIGTSGFRVGMQFTNIDPAAQTTLNQIMADKHIPMAE
jgi:c-di-GMP-binding flagellar brake protein YcgR